MELDYATLAWILGAEEAAYRERLEDNSFEIYI